MDPTAYFAIGFLIGGFLGAGGMLFILAMCRAASKADDYLDELENKAKYHIVTSSNEYENYPH
jgi:hypothetical protein